MAAGGGEPEFDAFLAHYRAPANPQEEIRYLYALASLRRPGLAARAFDLAMTEVRTQNAPFVLQLLVANRVTGPAVWQRVTEEWDDAGGQVPRPTSCPACSTGSGACADPPELAEQVTAFVENHPLPAGGKTVDQILERLAVNVAFGRRQGGGLATTLSGSLGLSPA